MGKKETKGITDDLAIQPPTPRSPPTYLGLLGRPDKEKKGKRNEQGDFLHKLRPHLSSAFLSLFGYDPPFSPLLSSFSLFLFPLFNDPFAS